MARIRASAGGGDGIFHKTYASVASDTLTVGFQPSKIFVSLVIDGTMPAVCCYDTSLRSDVSVQAYKSGSSVYSRALDFSSISASDAMISAVSSTGFTLNKLSNATNIEVVAIP